MFETLDHTIRIGSTPTFLYFDLYLYFAYAGHYVCIYITLVPVSSASVSACTSACIRAYTSTMVSGLVLGIVPGLGISALMLNRRSIHAFTAQYLPSVFSVCFGRCRFASIVHSSLYNFLAAIRTPAIPTVVAHVEVQSPAESHLFDFRSII